MTERVRLIDAEYVGRREEARGLANLNLPHKTGVRKLTQAIEEAQCTLGIYGKKTAQQASQRFQVLLMADQMRGIDRYKRPYDISTHIRTNQEAQGGFDNENTRILGLCRWASSCSDAAQLGRELLALYWLDLWHPLQRSPCFPEGCLLGSNACATATRLHDRDN